MKLTGAAILVSRGMKVLQAAPAAYPYRSAAARRGWMVWLLLDGGSTVGQSGSENGVIVRDEEHGLGARITLERDSQIAPFAIASGIYGWMCHTRFFGSEAEAVAEYERMKDGLVAILGGIPRLDDPECDAKGRRVAEDISAFVARFP
jgi:hypothetical protein